MQGTEQSEQSDVIHLAQCVVKCRHCSDLWMYLLDSRVCSWGFYRGHTMAANIPCDVVIIPAGILVLASAWLCSTH